MALRIIHVLRKISEALDTEYGINMHPVRRRTRCIGHIINLSLHVFLFASSVEALKAAIQQAIDEANDITQNKAQDGKVGVRPRTILLDGAVLARWENYIILQYTSGVQRCFLTSGRISHRGKHLASII